MTEQTHYFSQLEMSFCAPFSRPSLLLNCFETLNLLLRGDIKTTMLCRQSNGKIDGRLDSFTLTFHFPLRPHASPFLSLFLFQACQDNPFLPLRFLRPCLLLCSFFNVLRVSLLYPLSSLQAAIAFLLSLIIDKKRGRGRKGSRKERRGFAGNCNCLREAI